MPAFSSKIRLLLIGFYLLGFYQGYGYTVVISEIMADPYPARGLPEVEWIELTNISATMLNVGGFRIAKPGSVSGPLPALLLEPGQQLIVCSTSALPLMQAFGKAVSITSFPSLGNAGDLLVLRGPQGQTMHAIDYSDGWYRNELKKNGGWSLEMIDLNVPCMGKENWQASIDDRGGTPGRPNASMHPARDTWAPQLLHIFPLDSFHLRCVFGHSLDSMENIHPLQFDVDHGIGPPSTVMITPPLMKEAVLTIRSPLQRGKLYQVSCKEMSNCSGKMSSVQSCMTGLPSGLKPGEVVINEIMTNPTPGSADYVELYNASPYPVNLDNCHLANRNDAGLVSNISELQTGDRLLLPGGYAVFTEDSAAIIRNYRLQDKPIAIANLFQVNDLPAYPDDKGNVILTDQQGNLVDEVPYLDDWHHPLLVNTEGVSLERIEASMPSPGASTWHSASSLSNYGTPGYRNSQAGLEDEQTNRVNVYPATISPDNDGHDDYVTISFHLETPGTIMYLQVYSLGGALVRKPDHLQLNGREGKFTWDGLGSDRKRLPAGIYILCVNWQDLQGHTYRKRFPVVVTKS